ncbi:MAG: D-2-hydroxyacid dehydrogenase [Ardenticatenaceae bacterium]|nr:D-2-hydroxyacid dehydrogenase [Ardenticatenaceae bacterium]
MTHVLVTAPFPENLLNKIKSVSNKLQVEQLKLPNNRWSEGLSTEAEILYSLSDVPLPEQAPNLRWIQCHFAGVDSLIKKPIWDSGVVITSASGVHTTNMAQYVFTQILFAAGRVRNWINVQNTGEWPDQRWDKFVPAEIRGKTIGIVGYGSIGREVARIAKMGFGMQVLATKHNAKRLDDDGYFLPGTGDPRGEMVDRIYPSAATKSMVTECDYVVLTLPLTAETRYLIDESLLRAMKPTSILINIGRGALVNEADLVKGLKKGWIAGAGLDVFETEPLPADSPLWKMENVLLTPHVSGFTPHYDDRVTDIFVDNLRRYLAGEPLLNVVNRERGY